MADEERLRAMLVKAHAWILKDDANRFGPTETALWNKLLDEIEVAIGWRRDRESRS